MHGALDVDLAGQPVEQHPDLLLDQWLERLAVAQRVVHGEAERLLVTAGAKARDRGDDRDVVGVVAARGRGQDTQLLEPVLDLSEVLESELVAAREMVVSLSQPGASEPVRLLGAPIKLSRTPADPVRAPGPGLGDHTDEVLAAAGYSPDEIAALYEAGAVAGPAGTVQGSFLKTS